VRCVNVNGEEGRCNLFLGPYPSLEKSRYIHIEYLYLPSEQSLTGGYTVFTFGCLSVCVFALSPVFNSVLFEEEMYLTRV